MRSSWDKHTYILQVDGKRSYYQNDNKTKLIEMFVLYKNTDTELPLSVGKTNDKLNGSFLIILAFLMSLIKIIKTIILARDIKISRLFIYIVYITTFEVATSYIFRYELNLWNNYDLILTGFITFN